MSSNSPTTATPTARTRSAADEVVHDVDVVDHHVKGDADVDGAEGHGADAVDLDEGGREGIFF